MAITEEYLEGIKALRLIDDRFFTACLDNNIAATQLILNIILDKDDLIVESVRTQDLIPNPNKRAIKLDVHAIDSNKKEYNIEIQRSSEGAIPQRARYHSSLIDSKILDTGEEFQVLPEVYVIFITETDILKGNQSIYNIDRTYKVGDEVRLFGDGSKIVYVNGKYNGDDPIGKLIQDLWCSDPNQMNYKVLADITRHYKESEEGINYMCGIWDEVKQEEQRRFAEMLLKEGKEPENILHYFSMLSLEDLKDIQEKLLNKNSTNKLSFGSNNYS